VKGLNEVVLIHELRRQGLIITAIGRKVGCDRKPVRRHLTREGGEPIAHKIGPFAVCVRDRIADDPDLSAKRRCARSAISATRVAIRR